MIDRRLLPALLLLGCPSVRDAPPPVMPSSTAAATALVRATATAGFVPACLIVEATATVEWRNLNLRTPVAPLSVRRPYELSAPALAAPYNTVPADRSDECVRRTDDGSACAEALPYSYWRHTFAAPGIYDYRDAIGGVVTSAYGYGMPAGQATPTQIVGTVCVRPDSGSRACERVCCVANDPNACAPGVACIGGRCGGVSTSEDDNAQP